MLYRRGTSFRYLCLVVALCHLGSVTLAFAGPMGGTVVGGAATIDQAASMTHIRQSTDRAIINWQGFSSNVNETIRFSQPGTASVMLNRVTGGDASVLNGRLESNGQLFLLNPNGVLFGKTSQVNVGGLVASTLSMDDKDFMAGKYRLYQDANREMRSVVNQGSIEAMAGGKVALVAPVVNNQGRITAPGGEVALAAGTNAVIQLDGQGLVNLGVSTAPKGAVMVSREAASDLMTEAAGNQVLVNAGHVSVNNGVVRLGNAEGLAINEGTIDVSAPAGGNAGRVHLASTQATIVAPGSLIHANGRGAASNGGEVLMRSDGFSLLGTGAKIEAKGGDISGDGGFVDLSGKHIALNGDVDTAARSGSRGTFLIDPPTLTITDSPSTSGDLDFKLDDNTRDPRSVLSAETNGNDTITTGKITAITASNDVILEADNHIQFQVNGSLTLGAGKASTNPVITFRTTNAGSGQVGIDGSVGAGIVNPTGSLKDIVFSTAGSGHVDLSSIPVDAKNGLVSVKAGGDVSLGTTKGGGVLVKAGGNVVVGNVTASGSAANVQIESGGSITRAGGNPTITAKTVGLNARNGIGGGAAQPLLLQGVTKLAAANGNGGVGSGDIDIMNTALLANQQLSIGTVLAPTVLPAIDAPSISTVTGLVNNTASATTNIRLTQIDNDILVDQPIIAIGGASFNPATISLVTLKSPLGQGLNRAGDIVLSGATVANITANGGTTGGTVSLNASGKITEGALSTVIGQNVNLTAVTGIGSGQIPAGPLVSPLPLFTQAAVLAVDQSAGGDVFLANDGDVTVANKAGTGSFYLQERSGVLTVGSAGTGFTGLTANGAGKSIVLHSTPTTGGINVNAAMTATSNTIFVNSGAGIALGANVTTGVGTGNVYLIGSNGAITHTAGTVTGDTVFLSAAGLGAAGGGANSVRTAANQVGIDAPTGDVFLANTGATVFASSPAAGDIEIVNSGGSLTVGPVVVPASGTGILNFAGTTLSGLATDNLHEISLTATGAGNGIVLAGDVTTSDSTQGQVFMQAAGAISRTAGVVRSGTVYMRGLGMGTAGGGEIVLDASNVVADMSLGGNAALSNQLTVPGETKLANVSGSGQLDYNQISEDLNVSAVAGNTSRSGVVFNNATGITTAGSSVRLQATDASNGNIVISESVNTGSATNAATVFVNAPRGSITRGSGTITAGTVYLKGNGIGAVGTALQTASSNVLVDQSASGNAIVSNATTAGQNTNVANVIGNGFIDFTQTSGNLTVGTVTVNTFATITARGIQTSTNAISIANTGGNIVLDENVTTGSATAAVGTYLTSSTGSLTRSASAVTRGVGTVTSGQLFLAANGIGSTGTHLATNTSVMGVDMTAGGDAFLTNASPVLSVANRGAAAGKSFALLQSGGDLRVAGSTTPVAIGTFNANVPGTMNSVTVSGGKVLLDVTDAHDIRLDGNVNASNTGTAYLLSGGGVFEGLSTAGTVTAGTVFIKATGDVGGDVAAGGVHVKTAAARLGIDLSGGGDAFITNNSGAALTVAATGGAAGNLLAVEQGAAGDLTVANSTSTAFTAAAFDAVSVAPTFGNVTVAGGGSVLLGTAAGDIRLDGNVSVAGGNAYVLSGGQVLEAGSNGTITASLLYVKATGDVGVASSTGVGHLKTSVNTLGLDMSGGGSAFVSNSGAGDLTIAETGASGAQDLAIVQTGGKLTVGTSVAPATFDTAGTVTPFGGVNVSSGTGGRVLLQTATAGQDLLLAGDVSAAGDVVYLLSGGAIAGSGAGGTVTASSVLLAAGGDIGAAGSELKLATSNIGVDGSAGDVFLTNSGGDVLVANRNATAGKSFALLNTAGGITVAGATPFSVGSFDVRASATSLTNVTGSGAAAKVFFSATNDIVLDGAVSVVGGTAYMITTGGIRELASTSGGITAASLYLDAEGDIGAELPGDHLKTSVANLGVDASAAGHNVFITNTGSALNVANAVDGAGAGSFALSTTGGSLTVAGSAPFTVAAFETLATAPSLTGVTARGAGNVLLQVTGAGNDLHLDGDVASSSGNVYLLSGARIDEVAAGGTVSGNTLFVQATGNVGAESATGTGHLKTSVNSLALDLSGGGDAFVSNTGAADLAVAARGGNGAQKLAVVQTGGGLAVSTGINVTPFDAVGAQAPVAGITSVGSTGGKVLLSSTTAGKDVAIDGNVTTTGNTLYVTSAGKIGGAGTLTGNALYVKAGGDIGAASGGELKTSVNSVGVDAPGGNTFITNSSSSLLVADRNPASGKSLAVLQTGDLTVAGSTAFTAASFDVISAAPSFSNVSTAGGGALFLSAGGNLAVDGNVTAGGAGTAYLLAGGTIAEAGLAGTVTAGSLYLKADGSIGLESPGAHLKTSVANLGVEGSAGASGRGVFITNSGSSLSFAAGVDANGTQNIALVSSGGDVTVAGSTPFTVAAFETVSVAPSLTGVTARGAGKVLIQVNGIGNDLLIDGDVSVAGGTAYLLSGGQVQEAGANGAVTAGTLYVKATEDVGAAVPGAALKTHADQLAVDLSGGGSAFVDNSTSGDLKVAETGAAGAQNFAVSHTGGDLTVANAGGGAIAPATFDVAGAITPVGDVSVASGSGGHVMLRTLTAGGDIFVDGNVAAGGDSVYLIAAGDIQEAGSNGTVTADTLFLKAGGEIGVESTTGVGHLKTAVAKLGVDQTGGGSAYITNTGAVLVANTGATNGQDFALVSSGGNLTVAGATPFTAAAFDAVAAQSFSSVRVSGAGSRVLLDVTSNHTINLDGDVSADFVGLLAGNQILVTGTGTVGGTATFLKANGTLGTSGNHIRTTASTLLVDQTGGGDAFISNTSSGLVVANRGATAGQAFSLDQTGGHLTVAGSTPATVATFDVLAGLSSTGVQIAGVGGRVLLDARTSGANLLVDGDVLAQGGSAYLLSGGQIQEAGLLGTVTASTLFVRATGDVGGDLLAAGVHLKTAVSNLGVDQTGGGDAYISNTGDVLVANRGATAGQDFSLVNLGSITVANNTTNRVRANAFDSFVSTLQFGDVTVGHGAQPGGRVLLSATDAASTARNVLVDGNVNVADGSVYLLANGAIREAGANGRVTADTLYLQAGGDVGADVATGTHLNTSVAKLAIDQSGGGSAFVTNDSAGLTVANRGATNGQSLSIVQQNGNLTVGSTGTPVTAAAFDAFGTAASVSDLTVAGGGKVLAQVSDPTSATLHDLLLDGNLSVAGGTAYLLSSGRIQEGAGVGAVTANTLFIQAAGDVGTILPGGPHLETRVSFLGVDQTGGGSAYITNSGGALTVANTGAASGDFALVQSGGDLTVAGATPFTATRFDVVTADRSFANVSVGGAVSRVLLDVTDASALKIDGSVTGGTVYLATNGQLEVAGSGTVSAGTLHLDADGDIGTAANHLQTRASNLVVDQSGGGSAFLTNVSSAAGLNVANVAGTAGQSFALKQTGGNLTVAGATPLTVAAFDAVAGTGAASGLTINHGAQPGGKILLDSTDAQIKVDGSITATDGTVYLLAAQQIVESGAQGVVTADTLFLQAAGDIGIAGLDGTTHLQTRVANLAVDFSGGKNVFVTNTTTTGTALNVANANATAGSSFAVRQDGGDLIVANAGTPITVSAFDEIASARTFSNVTIANGGKALLQVTDPVVSGLAHDVLLDGNLSVATGQAYLLATGDIAGLTATSQAAASTLFLRAGGDVGTSANHLKTSALALGIDVSQNGDAFVTNVTSGVGNPGVNLAVNKGTAAQQVVVQQSGGDITVAGNVPFAIPQFDSAPEVQLNDVAAGTGSTVLLNVTDANDINVDGNVFVQGGTVQMLAGGSILSSGGLGQITAQTLFVKAGGTAGTTSAHLNTAVSSLGVDQSGNGDAFFTNVSNGLAVASTGSTGGRTFVVSQTGGDLRVAGATPFHVDAFDAATAQTFRDVTLGGTGSALLRVTDAHALVLDGDVSVAGGAVYFSTLGQLTEAGGTTSATTLYMKGDGIGASGNAIQTAAKNVVLDLSLDAPAFVTNAFATGTTLASAAGEGSIDFTQTDGELTVGQVTVASLDALTFASPFIGIRTVDENVRLAVTDTDATAGIVLSADVNTAGTTTTSTVYLTTAGGSITEGATTQGAALGQTVYLKANGIGATANRLKVVASNLGIDAPGGDVVINNSGGNVVVATGALAGALDLTQTGGTLTVGAVSVGAFGAQAAVNLNGVTTVGEDVSLAAVGSTNGVVLAGDVSTGSRSTATARVSAAGTITEGTAVQGTVTAGTVLLQGRGMGTATSRVKTDTEKLAIDQIAGGNVFAAGTGGATTVANRAGAGSLDVVQTNGSLSVGTVAVKTFNAATTDLTLTGATAIQGTSGIALATQGSGNLSFDAATTAAGAVTARSAGAIGGAATVTGASADLQAATGIGASGARLNTAAGTISAVDTTSGGIFLSNATAADAVVSAIAPGTGAIDLVQSGGGAVTFSTVTAGNGAVTLANTGGARLAMGNVTVGNAQALLASTTGAGELAVNGVVAATGGVVTLTAGGALTAGAGSLVSAADLFAVATSGIGAATLPLSSAVARLDARTVAGNAFLVQTGALSSLSGAATGGAFAFLSATGDVLVDSVSGANGVTLVAAAGSLLKKPGSGVNLTASNLSPSSLSASGVIGTAAAAFDVDVNTGTLTVEAAGQQNGVSVQINGTVNPDQTLRQQSIAPGLVLFNGRILLSEVADEQTDPRNSSGSVLQNPAANDPGSAFVQGAITRSALAINATASVLFADKSGQLAIDDSAVAAIENAASEELPGSTLTNLTRADDSTNGATEIQGSETPTAVDDEDSGSGAPAADDEDDEKKSDDGEGKAAVDAIKSADAAEQGE